MELDILKTNIEKKHKSVIKDIDTKLDKLFDDLLTEINKFGLNQFDIERLFKNGETSNVDATKKKIKTEVFKKPRIKLPEKIFVARNSLLTDLFEIRHFTAIYHIFNVIIIILFLNTLITDFLSEGKVNIGLKPILTGFRGLHYSIAIWITMQASTLAVFPVFKFWAYWTKKYFLGNSGGLFTKLRGVWNFLWISAVIAYQLTFIVQFTKLINSVEMYPASTIAVLMELIRFMMKSHAFIRTNVPRVMNSKNKLKVDDYEENSSDSSESSKGSVRMNDRNLMPTFQMYVYFLFAPTLIYRDYYPRTKHIRWGFVAKKLLEVVAIIFLLSFVFERFMIPKYRKFGTMQEVDVGQLVVAIFNCMMPGLLCFISGFYAVLHSWLNATSEMLRFADRLFYKDWWNSTSFAVYYRTWNIVVHDWLYLYIYKDFYEYIFLQNTCVCQFIVFTISALVHEYILGFTFRFLYPVMFILFEGFGVLLVFLTRKEIRSFGNILMWFSVAFGMGIMLSLYHIEYYARINCQNDNTEWWDPLVPLSWRCTILKYNANWKIQVHL